MDIKTVNEPRVFDVLTGEDLVPAPLNVRQLTLRQLKQTGDRVAEHIRDTRRKEFVAVSRELPESERTSFLVASARGNTMVTQEEMAEAADTLWGILNVLRTATDLSNADLVTLTEKPGNIETLDYARYHALGLDIDELKKAMEAAATAVGKKETKTDATFQSDPELG